EGRGAVMTVAASFVPGILLAPPSSSASASATSSLQFYSSSSTSSSIAPFHSRGIRVFKLRLVVCKVIVEEEEDTFQPPNNHNHNHNHNDNGTTSLDKWLIKLEQSINIFLTDSVIKVLDTLYHDRDYPRFFVLETIARVPYFAFISVLHMYESFGWWRKSDYLKVHFAESWNEMHHLLIMEELGGNAWWFDRFLAQHIAIFYYFMTVFMYAFSPRMACQYSTQLTYYFLLISLETLFI
ncbi:hypothetical protein M8C21_023108, partial [Ambrosia artemisiifolia]